MGRNNDSSTEVQKRRLGERQHSRNGDYEFASYRTIGVFSGKGNLAAKDGKAVAQGEKGNVTIQLLTDKTKGQFMLKAEGKGKDGISYRAELKKAALRKQK